MKITSISGRDWTPHQSFRIDLPDTGVVLLRGSNGTGKSSATLEAVSQALFGRGIRRRATNNMIPSTELRVHGAGFEVVRRQKSVRLLASAGDPELSERVRVVEGLAPGFGAAEEQGVTKSKEQARIEEYLGTWDAWRKASVFTREDMNQFSAATDADRKRYLEGLIGVHVFDEADARLKAKLGDAAATTARLEADYTRACDDASRAAAERRDADEVVAALPAPTPRPLPIPDPLVAIQADSVAAAEAHKAFIAARFEHQRLDQRAKDARHNAARAWINERDWDPKARCNSCNRPREMSDEAVEAERERLHQRTWLAEVAEYDAEDLLAAAAVSFNLARTRDLAAKERHEEGLRRLQEQCTEAAERTRAIAAWDTREADRARVLAAAERAATVDANAKRIKEEVFAACKEATHVEHVHHYARGVVGMRGVRARVLDRLLATLTTLANQWLVRMAPPELKIHLAVDGQARDAIALKVSVADGAQKDYVLCSSGEKKRIDFAILFALGVGLAERDDGTLFFDEVSDSLDADGQEVVTKIICDLAQTRCVVVITHDPRVVDMLPGAHEVWFHGEGLEGHGGTNGSEG